MNKSVYKCDKINSDTLIVSFAGNAKLFGGIQTFEFANFLNKHFENISKHFYIDKYINSYHQGIHEISSNIDETVNYFKNEIKNYKNVIFLGNSAGGYASILFGSLLNINYVLAFIPQTIRYNNNIDEKYRDISIFINNTTKYYIYGDKSISNINDCHHISHCERISHHPNVYLIKKEEVNLKKMRDNGELFDILDKLVNKIENNNIF
jgi:hypothetical protein